MKFSSTRPAGHLTAWEKGAVFALGAGSAYNILLYQLGFTLADAVPGAGLLWWSRVFFGLCSFVGFDLALGVTVMAMRDGRRSWWAALTILAVVLAAGGIGLDVAGVIAAPVLHAAPVLVLGALLLHLAAPRLDQGGPEVDQPADQADQIAVVHGPERQLEAPPADQELVQVGRRVVTLDRLATLVEIPKSTLSRKLDQITKGADHGRAE